MKLTLEGKPKEIQEILSFMHIKQADYVLNTSHYTRKKDNPWK